MYEDVGKILGEGGWLSQKLPRFESRESQQNVSLRVAKAFLDQKVALIEAGTGTGKSFAYLVPSLLYAHRTGKKVVITTHTIALQEQLLEKDLPLLMKALGFSLSYTLFMGMSQYVCRQRVELVRGTLEDEVLAFLDTAKIGTRREFLEKTRSNRWSQIHVDPDLCTGRKCPHFANCDYFRAKQRAQQSQIVVLNHHLLLLDLQNRQEGGTNTLGNYEVLVLDEAHRLEEVGRKALSGRTDSAQMSKYIKQVWSDHAPTTKVLRKTLLGLSQDEALNFLESTIMPHKALVYDEAFALFMQIQEFLQDHTVFRVKEPLPYAPQGRRVQKLLEELLVQLQDLEKKAVASLDDKDRDKVLECFTSFRGIQKRLEGYALHLGTFFAKPEPHLIHWIEQQPMRDRIILWTSPLDVSEVLEKTLFSQLTSVVLTSATLTTGADFAFMKKRLGITRETLESKHPSPFAWKQQALFVAPSDLLPPSHPDALEEMCQILVPSLREIGGKALILCTSYRVLDGLESQLLEQLEGYTFLKQGAWPREHLVTQFIQKPRTILLGTHAFWEGIDIPENRVKLVVITKLPFHVPTEPITEAILESYGTRAFYEYQMPQALLKFKQGFGRLIRHRKDRGSVLCLDSRVCGKSYGKQFLEALPGCRIHVCQKQQVASVLKAWNTRKQTRV